MDIVDVVENVDFCNLNWGVKLDKSISYGIVHTDEDVEKDFEVIENYSGIMPSQTQKLPSCVAESMVDLIEWWIFKLQKKNVSLDAIPLFRNARKKFWASDEVDSGGLYMGQAAKVAVDMGLVPPSTTTRIVPMNTKSVCNALKYSPVSVSSYVDNGWANSKLEPKIGQIDESEEMMPMYGHSTLLIGTNRHNNIPLVVGLNHWGPDWGVGGLFCMSMRRFLNTRVQLGIQLKINENDFKYWTGYEDYLIDHPEM